MRIIYDSDRGMELNTFIKSKKYSDQLIRTRMFYIIKANREDILKFGIAGNSEGNSISRFMGYRNAYGTSDKSNDCVGVKVHFVGVTEYNPNVETKNSEIFKLEKYVKRFIRENEKIARGSERTTLSLSRLKELVYTYRTKDKPTTRRISERNKNRLVTNRVFIDGVETV